MSIYSAPKLHWQESLSDRKVVEGGWNLLVSFSTSGSIFSWEKQWRGCKYHGTECLFISEQDFLAAFLVTFSPALNCPVLGGDFSKAIYGSTVFGGLSRYSILSYIHILISPFPLNKNYDFTLYSWFQFYSNPQKIIDVMTLCQFHRICPIVWWASRRDAVHCCPIQTMRRIKVPFSFSTETR